MKKNSHHHHHEVSEGLCPKERTLLEDIKRMLSVICTSNGTLDYLTDPESSAVVIKHCPGEEAEFIASELEKVLYKYVKFRQACSDTIDQISDILYLDLK